MFATTEEVKEVIRWISLPEVIVNYQLYQILGLHVKLFSQERLTDRHTHTHRRDRVYTLDGREKVAMNCVVLMSVVKIFR